MRSPRSVTLRPMGMPMRRRKFEIACFDRVTTGRWPVMVATSFAAASIAFAFPIASPIPMFTTTLSTRGICITFL